MHCVPKQSAVLHHFPEADVLISPLLICIGAQWGWDGAAVGLCGWVGAVWVGWGCLASWMSIGLNCAYWKERGEKKKHILRLLWRFGDLYQKAALMESLGGGSEKHRFFHCLPGCACAELAAGDLPTHGVHRLGTRSQKSLLVKFWT